MTLQPGVVEVLPLPHTDEIWNLRRIEQACALTSKDACRNGTRQDRELVSRHPTQCRQWIWLDPGSRKSNTSGQTDGFGGHTA